MGATEDRFNRAWEDELSRLFRKASVEERKIDQAVREGECCGMCRGEGVVKNLDGEWEDCSDCEERTYPDKPSWELLMDLMEEDERGGRYDEEGKT